MHRYLFIPLLLGASVLPAGAQKIEIKLATLAPDGSPWHQVLQKMGERWRNLSGGKVYLKIYTGSGMGDEPDLVRKMMNKQLHAVALSGAGMGDIEKGVACLQIPMLFQSYQELDCVRDKIAPRLEKMIEARGFIVLSWGDAGWVHFFTNRRAVKLDDIRQMKLFTWAGDNEELELWKANSFRPVPLAATDILPSLKTGLIEAVPTVPLLALLNQWFGIAKYMSNVKWAPLIGATVISKATWESIPSAQRPEMLKAARDSGEELRASIRKMGDDAVAAMTKRGLTVVDADKAIVADWRKQAEGVYPKLRGKTVPADLFDEVRKLHDTACPAGPN